VVDDEDTIMVFAPVPQLTVTIEQQGEAPELHVHPGGQGIWQARMCAALGASVIPLRGCRRRDRNRYHGIAET
jgi:hypothetical protein